MSFCRGLSALASLILLVAVVAVLGLVIYAFVSSYSSGALSAGSGAGPGVIGVDCACRLPSGGLRLFVRNLGAVPVTVTDVYFIDPASQVVLLRFRTNVTVPSGGVSVVTIPSIYLSSIEGRADRVRVVAASGSSAHSVVLPEVRLLRSWAVRLGLMANRYGGRGSHWVVFNFITGEYVLYDNTSGVVSGPYRGVAPVLRGVSEYIITTSWVGWGSRPVNSPILIVVNPTNANRDWAFTWRDPHGTFRFYLQEILGDKEVDFLVFWEDIFNPYHPRSLDDWKDHVVRVTVFTNGTYRIAVYMAKGGYSHEFYLNVTSEVPLTGNLVYRKPFSRYWTYYSGGYYREIPDKIYVIHS